MDNDNDLDIIENEPVVSDNENSEDYQADILELPAGRALSLEDTYSITSSEATRLIVLAGPSACGKTTLVTTLYQLFQRGVIGSYYFAGSQTLQGFEQRAFHTRTSSDLPIPETMKTRRGISDPMLHLKLWDSKINKLYNFLISDFSGEDYSSAIANVKLMQEDFGVLKRADTIMIIVDGDRISQKKTRYSTIEQSIDLLKTMHDANLLSKSVIIQIVISKYDLIIERGEKDPAILEYISKINDIILGKVSNIPRSAMRFFNIAAMPNNSSNCKVGLGLSEVLQSWTETRSVSYQHKPLALNSEFNKIQIRMLGASI